MSLSFRSQCPIASTLDVVGDRWSLVVLRDILVEGKTSFGDFAASSEGVASNVLADRLERLQDAGLVERTVDASDRRRINYVPTDAARALLPVLVALAQWGGEHLEHTRFDRSVLADVQSNLPSRS